MARPCRRRRRSFVASCSAALSVSRYHVSLGSYQRPPTRPTPTSSHLPQFRRSHRGRVIIGRRTPCLQHDNHDNSGAHTLSLQQLSCVRGDTRRLSSGRHLQLPSPLADNDSSQERGFCSTRFTGAGSHVVAVPRTVVAGSRHCRRRHYSRRSTRGETVSKNGTRSADFI